MFPDDIGRGEFVHLTCLIDRLLTFLLAVVIDGVAHAGDFTSGVKDLAWSTLDSTERVLDEFCRCTLSTHTIQIIDAHHLFVLLSVH